MTKPTDAFIPGGPGTPKGTYETTGPQCRMKLMLAGMPYPKVCAKCCGIAQPGLLCPAKGETTDPRIFITVQRLVAGQQVVTRREIDLTLWLTKRPFHMLDVEIDAMLREVFYGG
jgi:hypothetical protein